MSYLYNPDEDPNFQRIQRSVPQLDIYGTIRGRGQGVQLPEDSQSRPAPNPLGPQQEQSVGAEQAALDSIASGARSQAAPAPQQPSTGGQNTASMIGSGVQMAGQIANAAADAQGQAVARAQQDRVASARRQQSLLERYLGQGNRYANRL